MKEILEKLIQLTRDGEVLWSMFADDNIEWKMKCEKLDKFNVMLYVNKKTGHLILTTNRFSEYQNWHSCQIELQNLLATIESTNQKVTEFKKWLDNYDYLVVEKTSHTWKLPNE